MQIKKLFLASSSELMEDRRELQLQIARKNDDLVEQRQEMYFQVICWENFLDAFAQTRLQDEYNKRIRTCAVFVMLFWNKVGLYAEEEFDTAVGQFKAMNTPFIFTYFKDAPAATPPNELERASVTAFQKKLHDLGHFYTTYKNTDALKLHFKGQLDRLITERFVRLQAPFPSDSPALVVYPGRTVVGSDVHVDGDNAGVINTQTQIIINYHRAKQPRDAAAVTAGKVTHYLKWLQSRMRCIELRGLRQGIVELPLETAFVPLAVQALTQESSATRRVAIEDILAEAPRLVILGGPGSGKTTVLIHIAWALASSLLTKNSELARSRLGLHLAADDLPLPIFVPLASFARQRRDLTVPASRKRLDHFISDHLSGKASLPKDFFEQLVEDECYVILLLDGLDEVANEEERAEVRQSVEDLIANRPMLRVVVTCRTLAYQTRRTALSGGFAKVVVQPLDPEEHVMPMVQQAYACIHPADEKLHASRSANLLQGIRKLEEERRVRLDGVTDPFVSSPLMVRLLLILHVENRELPDERAELFDRGIESLLRVDYGREESDNNVLAEGWMSFRDMAQHLAICMHRQGIGQGREIEEPALKTALREEEYPAPALESFISHARHRGSLFEERDGAYRFIHLAFQEFLVARHLREIVGGEGHEAIIAFLSDWLEDPWWREPILLLVGYQAAKAAKSARSFLAMLARAGATGSARFHAAELAATAALEWRSSGVTTRRHCAERIVELLEDAEALQQSAPILRSRAAAKLALLGDPRFDAKLFHLPADDMLGFVPIAADADFRIGTRRSDATWTAGIVGYVPEEEINDAASATRDFYMARYPVTVAQFSAFTVIEGLRTVVAQALRGQPNSPVTHVSWADAQSYCEWLNEALMYSAQLAPFTLSRLVREHGWRVVLPSELEWEVAARGGLRDAIFSWGNEPDANRANYRESGIHAPTAVGCFPANGFGLFDMLGNTFEWTEGTWESSESAWATNRNRYSVDAPRPTDAAPRAETALERVARGGAFLNDLDATRCGFRFGFPADKGNGGFGFRLALRAPDAGTSQARPLWGRH